MVCHNFTPTIPSNLFSFTVHCKKCGVSERPMGPGEQYFHVSMETHTVTTETGKYCSPGAFSYTTFFTSLAWPHPSEKSEESGQLPTPLLQNLEEHTFTVLLMGRAVR